MTGGSVPVAPSGSEREAAILRPPIVPCVHYPALIPGTDDPSGDHGRFARVHGGPGGFLPGVGS
jgi:hypothetical protein